MYGSSLMSATRRPRLSSKHPIEDAARPLPRLETTPPVTKIYLGIGFSIDSLFIAAVHPPPEDLRIPVLRRNVPAASLPAPRLLFASRARVPSAIQPDWRQAVPVLPVRAFRILRSIRRKAY